MKTPPVVRFACYLLSTALLLSACQLANHPTVASTQAVTQAPQPTVLPTTTPALPRNLTICLGQEPNTLYPLGNLNTAARSVLSAIYEGPIDVFTNGYQPVILQTIPSVKNGDAQITPVAVKRGDQIVDASGVPQVLDTGVKVYPSGCTDDSCAVTYDGQSNLQMDQLVVTYRMLTDLKWSDGTPVTAQDSVYAFQLASDPATPVSKYVIDRTQSYETVDTHTVQWWGKPGFIDPTYVENFWAPLPQHAWNSLSAADLVQADTSARLPIGWGPYIFKDWSKGDSIRLVKNPNYFRASDGLPKFDTLTFKFLQDANVGISDLLTNQCDMLDTSLRLDGQIDLLTQLQKNDQVKLVVSTTPLIERLDFGINPASYDNGYDPTSDRPDFFGDVRTRQGIAYCLDRQKVVDTVLAGLSDVPDSYVIPNHPLLNPSIATYPFDINKGIELLNEAGWIDDDHDPSTPLKAQSVKGVPAGTPFIINYWTTSALQRRQVSDVLSQSLAQCGIQVNVKYYDPNAFYAQGPDGPLFGRNFDLAEYAIGVVGTEPPCSWFMTSEIPNADNHWVGVNVSGYSNSDYDTACLQAMHTLPDQPQHPQSYDLTQTIFANDLPSIPLYQRIKVAVVRSDLCNFTLDTFSTNDLWDIADLDYKPSCKTK